MDLYMYFLTLDLDYIVYIKVMMNNLIFDLRYRDLLLGECNTILTAYTLYRHLG